jgi:hypothetical protein
MPSDLRDVDPRELRLPSSRLGGGILRLLERASELDPDARFGQLVAFLPVLVDSPAEQPLADLEDESLLEALRHHVGALSLRKQSVA